MPVTPTATDRAPGGAHAAGGAMPRQSPDSRLARAATPIRRSGAHLARLGLAVVIGWIGLLKFIPYEAEGVRGLIGNSPLLSWMYGVWSVQGTSNVIGIIEVTAAVLILLRPLSPRAAAVGSLIAVGMFLTTLSFLFTTPGIVQPGHSFPALSGGGGFLLKDIVFLGVALWSLGESLEHAAARRGGHVQTDRARVAQ
jgi:uncharacterized membrane protein YkgB